MLTKEDAQNLINILDAIPDKTNEEMVTWLLMHNNTPSNYRALLQLLDNVITTQAQIMRTTNEVIFDAIAGSLNTYMDQLEGF